MLEDNEFEYYRLIGEAYNNHILNRASLSPQNITSLMQKVSTDQNSTNTNQFYTYVINGIPQTVKHNEEFDETHGYSKQVLVQQKTKEFKLYSTTCNKLKYNDSKDRINECRLATGYFIVN